MTEIIKSLSQISADYDALFCDLWGCLHNGKTPYPAAVSALLAFRAKGGKVCLMTNAPRPNQFVMAQLDKMGVPRDAWDVIVSSGDAAQEAMLSGLVGHKVWHVGTAKDDGFFDDLPAEYATSAPIKRVSLDEAEGIVVTGPFDEENETPEDYRAHFEGAVQRNLPMICANPDLVVDLGETRIYCAGALSDLYEKLGGQTYYFGKPHAPIYARANRLLNLSDSARTLAVGDGILTDVLGARQEGIDCLFVTGGLAASEFGEDVELPDAVRLLAWLKAQNMEPRYSIGRLR